MKIESKIFIYSDAHGNISAREVSNISESDEYIQALCHSSQALRTFRKDRILEYILDRNEIETKLKYHIANSPPPTNTIKRNPENKLEVCFTGFKKADKERLNSLAKSWDLYVRPSVTSKLAILCCGYNAGPTKMEKARHQGVMVLSECQFDLFLKTGEVPEEA